jgi:hydroxyacylglutathione hydrolase
MQNLSIIPIPAFKDNYIWALCARSQKTVVIIDPGDAYPVIQFLQKQQLKLAAILITHHHADHTAGIKDLLQIEEVPVYGPANEHIQGLTHPLLGNEIIQMPHISLDVEVMLIPGHTLWHLAYYAKPMLFCGDTLFAAGCGRLFEGTAAQLFYSLQQITALADDTKIYCGHEYTLKNLQFAHQVEPGNKKIIERLRQVAEKTKNNLPSLPSTVLEEKQTNPFLRCDMPEIIASVEHYADCRLSTALQVFTWLRKWKDGY